MTKWNIGWGTVSLCNMNCQFCYSRHRRIALNDLQFADWIQFVDENYAYINSINYGTGENTLNLDWFRLVEYIRKKYPQIRQALTTNGYLSVAVSKNAIARRAFEIGIDEIDVSLDFCNREKHGELRGQPYAYDWALDTLKLCQETGKSATLVFIGSKVNLYKENIDGLFAIAKKHNAILRMNLFRPTIGINANSLKFIASYKEIVDILTYISQKYGILALNDTLYSARLLGMTSADPSGDCSIRILADGSITPSTYLIDEKYIIGNIKDKDVINQLEQKNDISKIIYDELPKECVNCVYSDKCRGGVYDRRYLWFGTLKCRDPHCPGPIYTQTEPALKVISKGFISVHDGYLPTMFFTTKHEDK